VTLSLEAVSRCFHGIAPSAIATASADGAPNITFLSHVYYVDAKHVALSCQFFNKTRQNIAENPFASVQLHDPVTLDTVFLELEYQRSETSGALFETMRARLAAIAAHSGMLGVFKLISADVYRVLEVRRVAFPDLGDVEAASLPDPSGPLTEMRGLQTVSSRINAAASLDQLLSGTLQALDEALGFEHSMLLLVDETGQRLFAVESHGYGESGVGAEVQLGHGVIGMCAEQRKPLRTVGMVADLRYGRAIRERAVELGHDAGRAEVPLPGLPAAQSQIALPLVVGARLLGVLAVESEHALRFQAWHETFLELITNQVALALERMTTLEEKEPPEPPVPSSRTLQKASAPTHEFWFFPGDDCVFVDGEYLVRNLPGKILWRVLREHEQTGRTEFTNRELRLDPTLGLPAIKDNLESRLILLRRRLDTKSCGIRIVPVRRGRFALEVEGPITLLEKAGST
jgi:adenylate cyclase